MEGLRLGNWGRGEFKCKILYGTGGRKAKSLGFRT